MLTLTSPVETPLHHLPAGLKLALLALAGIVLFRVEAPVPLALALTGIWGLHLAGGRRMALAGLVHLRPLWPFVAVIAIWHLWTGAPLQGLVLILRMLALVMAANLVTMTTGLQAMIDLLTRLARPLALIGLPPARVALALAMAIRFVPVLLQRAGTLSEAWRARSPRRPGARVVGALALAALDEADHVAEALRARGGVG